MRTSLLLSILLLAACGDHQGGAVDAAPTIDSAPAIDAAVAASCGGAAACDPAAQYCYEVAAGVWRAALTPGCEQLPASCLAGPPTCDCVLAALALDSPCGVALTCTADGGRLTVTCALP